MVSHIFYCQSYLGRLFPMTPWLETSSINSNPSIVAGCSRSSGRRSGRRQTSLRHPRNHGVGIVTDPKLAYWVNIIQLVSLTVQISVIFEVTRSEFLVGGSQKVQIKCPLHWEKYDDLPRSRHLSLRHHKAVPRCGTSPKETARSVAGDFKGYTMYISNSYIYIYTHREFI